MIFICLRGSNNSDLLVLQFVKGAQETGNQVETIGKTIQFCAGCMSCLKAPACVLKGDANVIVRRWVRPM